MITIYELNWTTVPAFIAWALVVYGLGEAIFRSFLVAEFRRHLPRSYRQYTDKIHRTAWSLQNGYHYNRDLATNNPDAEKIAVTKEDREQMAAFLARASWLMLPVRVLDYLVRCVFCHSTWVAVVILCWGGSEFWRVALPSSVVYGVVCKWLGLLLRVQQQVTKPTAVSARGCAG